MKADGDFHCDNKPGAPGDRELARRGVQRRHLATVFLSAAAGLLLAGCAAETVTYKLTPPKTPEGKACVDKCGEQRATCVNDQQSRFADCKVEYKETMAIYTRCRNSSLSTPGSQFACEIPRACSFPTPEPCEQPYRACFEACGGKVEEVKSGEEPAAAPEPAEPAKQPAAEADKP
jgi:hypothetical protein